MAIWFLTAVSRLNGVKHMLIKKHAAILFSTLVLLPLCLPVHASLEDRQSTSSSSNKSLLKVWDSFLRSKNNSDQVIIRSSSDELTLAQLNRQSLRLGKHLQVRLGTGKRVAVLMPSSPKLLVVLLGILRAGLVPVIIPADGNSEELFHSLGQKLVLSRPAMLISGYEYSDLIRQGLLEAHAQESSHEKLIDFYRLPLLLSSNENTDQSSSGHPAWLSWLMAKFSNMMFRNSLNSFDLETALRWGEEDLLETGTFQQDETALILFSASKAGSPKAITITHRNLQSNEELVAGILKSYPELSVDSPSMWMPVSMTDPFGLAVTLRVLPLLQGTLHVAANHQTSKELISSLEKSKPHVIFAMEGVLKHLLLYKSASTRKALGDRLKFILLGGSVTSPLTRKAVRGVFGIELTESYWFAGSTMPIALEVKPGEGLSLLSEKGVWIVPPQGTGDALSYHEPLPDTEGQIHISGDYVCPGYLDDESTKRACYIDSSGKRWLATGDWGLITGNGNLKVKGRMLDQRDLDAEATSAEIISTVVSQLKSTERGILNSPKNDHASLRVHPKVGDLPLTGGATAKSARKANVLVFHTGLMHCIDKAVPRHYPMDRQKSEIGGELIKAATILDSSPNEVLPLEEQARAVHNFSSNTK